MASRDSVEVVESPVDHASAGGGSWSATYLRLGWVIVAVGVILRVARWSRPRSLWLDELMLAHSVVGRSFHDLLFKPLDFWQSAPAGFLGLEWLCVHFFGADERALRLPALLLGIAALPLFLGIVRRLLPARAAILALILFATMEPLVYYSDETKQYAGDVTVWLAIALCALRSQEQPADLIRISLLGIVGILGIVLSHPCVFMLAGIGLVLGISAIRGRDARRIGALVILATIWAAVFVVDFWIFHPTDETIQGVTHYWRDADGFMPAAPIWAARWLWTALWKLFHEPSTMWMAYPDLAVALALIGVAVMWMKSRSQLILLLAPLPLAALASAMHRYPFADRLILWIVPMAIIYLAVGACWLLERAGPLRWPVGIILSGMLIVPAIQTSVGYLLRPPGREESKAALAYVAAHRQAADCLWVFPPADLPFQWYASRCGLTGMPRIPGINAIGMGMDSAAAGFAGRGRVWLFFSHIRSTGGVDDDALTLLAADKIGRRLDQFTVNGSKIFLYDFPAKINVQP